MKHAKFNALGADLFEFDNGYGIGALEAMNQRSVGW